MIFFVLFIIFVSCESKNPALRIWGGEDAAFNEFSYVLRMILLYPVDYKHFKMMTFCTCSAITEIWSLTAAHCIEQLDPDVLTSLGLGNIVFGAVIRHGSKNMTVLRKNEDNFSLIIKSFKHPTYSRTETIPMLLRNDIGLLQQHPPILLKHYGRISAVDHSTVLGQTSFLVGYGLAKYNDSSMKVADTLASKRKLQVVKGIVKRCDSEVHNFIKPILCLSGQCGKSQAMLCPGDSGGPLIHRSGILGVNSLGSMCIDPRIRVMFEQIRVIGYVTPVSPFLHWITIVMKENVFDAKSMPQIKQK